MAAVSTPLHPPIKTQDHSEDDPYSPHTRDTITPEYEEEKHEERQSDRLTSSFSIHNVLKKERDENSPENLYSSNNKLLENSPENVFCTNKLLENTPEFEDNSRTSSLRDEDECNSSFRAEISVGDENSCCSDDTVLSVGNEAPINEARHSNINKDLNPGLTSFKHIQTHLNAISQLSQNLTLNQPMLLRPSPITPNPLIFLNQPLLFQNPLINHNEIQKPMPNRIPIQNNVLNQNQGFGLNFGLRKNINPDRSRVSTDENRRIHYMTPKSPDQESRDYRENCLKFSIDNILKADFGRRITDPLTKRKSSSSKRIEACRSPVKEAEDEEVRVVEGKERGAIDLSKDDSSSNAGSTPGTTASGDPMVWPAWVYCTRYSDRPSSGRSKYGSQLIRMSSPRTRRPKKPPGEGPTNDEKRPRTAFSGPQLARLKHEFAENRYLTERRRQALAAELGLAEAQIKIWFQNKRAKIKKASGQRNPLALQLMAQGLYNHSTVPLTREEEELEMKAREREKELQNRQ